MSNEVSEAPVMEPVESFDGPESSDATMEAIEEWGDLDANEHIGEAPSEGSDDSIDDFDDIPTTVSSEDDAQADEEQSAPDKEGGEEALEEEAEAAPEEDSEGESDEEESEDSENEEDSEEIAELPKELSEKGIVQSEEGALGKMIKIDGEEAFVSLEELGNDYSGQQALSKRFTEIDKREKSFGAEVQSIEKYIGEFADKMQNGDVLGAFSYFGQFSGTPPHMVKEQLVAALRPEIERRMSLSEQEIQNEQVKEENEYLKELNESEVKRREEEQASTELQSSINSVRETHSIDIPEWDTAVQDLLKDPDLGEVTPELVGDYIVNLRAYGTSEAVLTSLDMEINGNDHIVQSLQQIIINNPDFTQEQLQQIVQGSQKAVLKQDVEKKLQPRIQKNAKAKKVQPKAKPSEVAVPQASEYDLDWDDL